jgi:subtilisin family serine protease
LVLIAAAGLGTAALIFLQSTSSPEGEQSLIEGTLGPTHPIPPVPLSQWSPCADAPRPDSNSEDPAERLVADCEVLREVWQQDSPTHWTRHAVLLCPATRRKLDCREKWIKTANAQLALARRDLSSGEHVLVQTSPATKEHELRFSLAPFGFNVRERIAEGLYTVQLPGGELLTVAEAIARLHSLRIAGVSARPDGIGFGAAVPNDPLFPDTYNLSFSNYGQWNLRNTGARINAVPGTDIGAMPTWDILQTTPAVTIAVLDSGLRTNHPDLAGIKCRGTNLVATNSDFTDDETKGGHGTGVTAVIAADRNNGIGLSGIVGAAEYLIVKVLNNTNYGSTSDVIKGLDYALTNNASVVNMSLVGFPDDPDLRNAIARCESNGILLCISAGNDGTNNDVKPNYPSSFTNANIISVGGHDWSNQRWTGGSTTNAPSNYGATSVDLFAPGARIPSAAQTNIAQTNSYLWWNGTSVATPHVTAVAALIKGLNPSWAAPQIKEAILSSVATNANYSALCTSGGRLDALKAVGQAITQAPSNDTDGDDADNLLEYLAGTRTDDFSSQPRATGEQGTTNFTVTMPRVVRAGAKLVAEQNANLDSAMGWTTNGISEAGDVSTFRASVPFPGIGKGFLRIRGATVP